MVSWTVTDDPVVASTYLFREWEEFCSMLNSICDGIQNGDETLKVRASNILNVRGCTTMIDYERWLTTSDGGKGREQSDRQILNGRKKTRMLTLISRPIAVGCQEA